MFTGRTHAEAETPILWPPDVVDRVHETEVGNTVQEVVTKTIPKKKKHKKAKWLSEEPLQ